MRNTIRFAFDVYFLLHIFHQIINELRTLPAAGRLRITNYEFKIQHPKFKIYIVSQYDKVCGP